MKKSLVFISGLLLVGIQLALTLAVHFGLTALVCWLLSEVLSYSFGLEISTLKLVLLFYAIFFIIRHLLTDLMFSKSESDF